MVIRDIKTLREDRRRNWIDPKKHRGHFLGQSALDLQLSHKIPGANIKQDGSIFEMEILMPGFTKDEIEITVEGDILWVKGTKLKDEHPKSNYVLWEFDVDKVERRFNLAKDVGKSKIDASYENGILTLIFSDVPHTVDNWNRKVELS